MSLSTVTATVQDPSGQVFANGTWQLIFKPTPNTPGAFTDGGAPFTRLFSGSLDNTGSFSQAVARNDTIAPAGSKWTLVVAPNASGQAYQIDLFINSANFNASAAINAIITNISIVVTGIAHAYQDAEVGIPPVSGGIYYNVVSKFLKVWDIATQAWITATATTTSPSGTGFTHNTAGVQDSNARAVDVSSSDITGVLKASAFPALTGDVTTPSGSVATTLAAVATPGTGTKVTFNAKGLVTSGANAQLASADFANQGTATTVLHGNAAGSPSFGAVSLATDVSGVLPFANQATPTGTGFDHVTAGVKDGASKLVNLTASTDVAPNQGAVNTVLHGNAAGQASFGAVTPSDAAGNTTGTGNFVLQTSPVLDGFFTLQETSAPSGTVGFLVFYEDSTSHQWKVSRNGGIFASVSTSAPRIVTLASSTTFTPDADNSDQTVMNMTGVAGTLTIAAPTGTPADGQKLTLRIKTTNAQAYSFNATYRFSTTVATPTTTQATKTDYIGCIWNALDSKWDVVAYDTGH